MLVELLCLLVFTVRLVHYAKVIPRDKFWKDPKNICIIVILMVGGAYPYHQSDGSLLPQRPNQNQNQKTFPQVNST